MTQTKAISLFLRGAAVLLALAGLPGRDSSAKVFFQGAGVVVVPNLVGYWAVDTDTGTTATDSSGLGNTGTYSPVANPATTSTTVQPVPAGNLRSFNFAQANNQFISVPDSNSLSLTGSFTLAAWIRPTVDSTVQQGIIEKYDDVPASANGYSFRLSASEYLAFSLFSGTTQYGISTAPRTVPLNAWTHVAGVYNATAQTLVAYKSDDDATDLGAPDPTQLASVPPPTNGVNVLQIGKDYGANAFNGNVDEVRIYNRALTQAEIAILKTGQAAPTGLVATGGNSQNILTWTAAPGATSYSVLRGTAMGVYATVFNGIAGTTYSDATVIPGTPYFYVVVAVSVMASGYSNVQTATANNTPPPPPPPPRTTKNHEDAQYCGCGSAGTPKGAVLALGLLLTGLILLLGRRV